MISSRPRAFLALVVLVAAGLPLAGDASTAARAAVVPVSTNAGCDPVDPSVCLFPFPNDLFTASDATTDTGRRVALNPLAMPRSGTEITQGGEGKPVDPTEWNRNDGFSPGSMVLTHVEDLDLPVTWGTQDRPHAGAPNEPGYFDHRDHIADIGLYLREDAPMVIVNADTGERHPFWSELDTHPDAVSAGEQALILRPARNFEEGARYVVALRNLKRSDGTVIEPGDVFAHYRDGEGADAARQAHYDTDVFSVLEEAGIGRDDLFLAWDFSIASARNLAERILHIRDDAFGRILGDENLADRKVEGDSPAFTVDSISDRTDTWTDSRGVSRSQALRRIEGRVTVPNYMDRIQQTEGHVKPNHLPYDPPVPGSRFLDLNGDGLPDQNPVEPTVNVPFVCDVPLNGEENHGVLYGHGLLGTRSQIGDVKSPRRNGPFFGCGADWWGMSTPDLPTVVAIIADLSNFPSLPDRAQQGFLNFMFLGRAMVHPEGFASHPAFQDDDGSLVKTATEDETPLFYDGNSQGGIMGGSLVAVSPDISRAILGVPAMNYSTLLNRSVDWEGAYAVPFYEVYRDPLERQLSFSLIQMLWDRGETNGYAEHLTTDPLPNTPPHEVMLQVAYSDHQVANVAAEVEAHTIGAPIMLPGLPEGRHWEMDPYFAPTATYPHKGSALIYWDSGNATPPNGNIPPTHNGDPHGHPRNEPAASWQEAHFLLTGWMEDVCDGADYLTLRHPANGGSASCIEPDWEPGSRVPGDLAETSLAFTGGSASSGQFSDETTFEVALTRASSGASLVGAEIVFELGDDETSRAFETTTDSNGIARVTPVLIERPGTYRLTATFAGDDDHAPSTAVTSFEIEREDTTLSLQLVGRGSSSQLEARLADEDSNTPIVGREIDFYANGEWIGSGVTHSQGVATLSVPPRYRGRNHEFEARFAGDDYFLPSGAILTR